MAQGRLLLRFRRSLERASSFSCSQESVIPRHYHSVPASLTSQTDGLNQAAGLNQENAGGHEKKFGPQRPVLTTVSSRWKFKLAAEKLFKAAAAKDSPADDQTAAPDVTTISITPPPYVKTKKLGKTAAFIMEILNKEAVAEAKKEREIPELKPGYIVRLKVELPENKRRVQEYKGIIIAMRNAGIHTTFRIRRQVGGTFVENVLPLYSPLIKEFEVLDKKRVRRAKLYYLREGDHKLKSIKVKKKPKTRQSDGRSSEFKLPPPPADNP